MMSTLLSLHLLAVGIWVGCIAVETVVELSGDYGDEQPYLPAKLHRAIDLYIEIPVLTALLVTGFLLVDWSTLGGLLLVKVLCGIGAVATNFGCAVVVFKRKRWADLRDEAGVETSNRHLAVLGALFFPLSLATLAIGLYLLLASA
jgi:hypothetical protein